MERRKNLILFLLVFCAWTLSGDTYTAAETSDITGIWYGTFQNETYFWETGNFSINIFEENSSLYAMLHIWYLNIFDEVLPVTIDGDTIIFGDPQFFGFDGTIDGQMISGSLYLPPPYLELVTWQAYKYTGEDIMYGPAPGPQCNNLPPLFCPGTDEYCSEIVPFEPVTGPGYINGPNLETWEDQYRSFIRRDVMMLVKYATAKVECKTSDWDYGNHTPLALLDMSEADGSIPGTSIGNPTHPPGSHEDGMDIDLAFYQLYAPDNKARPVCMHCEGGIDLNQCVGPPYALDRWRTALLIAYLSEHPRVRVIGVDQKVGEVLEQALDDLMTAGWIDQDLRNRIILGHWEFSHHHHIHLSTKPVYPGLLLNVDLQPESLNRKSEGNFITAYIELDENLADQTDQGSVALILDGNTMLYAESEHWEVSDYNQNGIPDLMVKFDRQAVLEAIGNGEVEISITGSVYDYYFFQGTDTISVFE